MAVAQMEQDVTGEVACRGEAASHDAVATTYRGHPRSWEVGWRAGMKSARLSGDCEVVS
jgi:hypothetical protein